MYRGLAWVVSVMLPPMAIFFPLFTLLEDLGYLPRVAFNLDRLFKAAGAHGKQALTMCMGFGCNAAGVISCRIIDSPRERLLAILTNNFVPCNGRFPLLITLASIFMGGLASGRTGTFLAAGLVVLLVLAGVLMTLLVSWFLSHTILQGSPPASPWSFPLPQTPGGENTDQVSPRPHPLCPQPGGNGSRPRRRHHLDPGQPDRRRCKLPGPPGPLPRPLGPPPGHGRDADPGLSPGPARQ